MLQQSKSWAKAGACFADNVRPCHNVKPGDGCRISASPGVAFYERAPDASMPDATEEGEDRSSMDDGESASDGQSQLRKPRLWDTAQPMQLGSGPTSLTGQLAAAGIL